jgi:hypothetical protein
VKITRIKTVHTVETDQDKIYRRVDANKWLTDANKWLTFSESNWLPIDNPGFVDKLEALFQKEIAQ